MFEILKKRLIWEKEFTKTSYERFKKELVYTRNNVIDSDGNMSFTVDSLIEINNIIIDSNNITLKKVDVKPYEFDKIYMDKDLIENKLYQRLDQFHEMKITPVKFHSITLSKIHTIYDGNDRTCKPLFSNDDKVKSLLMRQKLK